MTEDHEWKSLFRFLLVLFVLQAGYVMATSMLLFDRHLLLLSPTAIGMLALATQRLFSSRLPVVAMTLIIFAAYGIVCGHDVHAMTRETFFAGEDLRKQGVPVDRIDAGLAFDTWHMYEQSYRELPPVEIAKQPWWPTRQISNYSFPHPWWIGNLVRKIDPEYAVTISKSIPSWMYQGKPYERIASPKKYRTFWPYRENPVYVFRRLENDRKTIAETLP